MKKILIVGASGFGAEAIWVLEEMNKLESSSERWEILGFVDDDATKKNVCFYDYKVLGSPEDVCNEFEGQDLWYFCAIGNNEYREKMVNRLDGLGLKAATLIHPSVIVARGVSIAEGTYIGAFSVICPNATIDKHVLINVRVAIGHDSIMHAFSQACPGSQINGSCEVGHSALVGSNAAIIPGKKIGANAVVCGNSQVISSVKKGDTVIGVPARKI